MRRSAALVTLALLLTATPVLAKYGLPASAGLNLAGPAGEYLSVANKADIQGNPNCAFEAWVSHATRPVGLGAPLQRYRRRYSGRQGRAQGRTPHGGSTPCAGRAA